MGILLTVIFATAVALSLLLTWSVRLLATRWRLVSIPVLDRHLHSKPIPRIGGVAVFFAFCLAIAFSYIGLKLAGLHDFGVGIRHDLLVKIVFAGALVWIVGVLDDIFGLTPWPKLFAEVCAAALLYMWNVRIADVALFPNFQLSGVISFALTVGFVVAITNAFNLIDGMDGLASGSALVSTIAVGFVGLLNHSNPILVISVALAGALIGFLRFNFNPATIFLGDSGSLFIGFMLAATALEGTRRLPVFAAVVAPMLAFALPVMDTSLSVMRRFFRGQPIFQADRDHIHHRLLLRGLSQKHAVLVLYGASGIFALLGLVILYRQALASAIAIVVCCIIVIVAVHQLEYEDLKEMRNALVRVLHQRDIISANIELRRLLPELERACSFEDACGLLDDRLRPYGASVQYYPAKFDANSRMPHIEEWCLFISVGSVVSRGTLLLRSAETGVSFDFALLEQCGLLMAEHYERDTFRRMLETHETLNA